jgi:hypothetical protein
MILLELINRVTQRFVLFFGGLFKIRGLFMIKLRCFVCQFFVIAVKYLDWYGSIVRGKHFVVRKHGLSTI